MNDLFTQSRALVIRICLFILLYCYAGKIAAQCTNNTAATSYASNNGSRGAMFNITAGASAVTITSFDANLYGGTTAKYEIYYKAGTYVGSETTAANWTLAGAVNSLYVAANNVPTAIPIPLSITIPAGATYGFYITNTASGGMNYTSSAITNVTLISNSDITLTGGVGKAYPFGATYSYRLINCTVHYYTGTISESNTLATVSSTSQAISQSSSSSTLYSSGCNSLIAKVTGTGGSPASGSTVAKVWIDATQPVEYVKRHYQITPASNGTARVTLYYTDAEFNAFNTQSPAPPLLLPVSTDAGTITARKANLRIERRPGTSSNNTGEPNTYTGAAETIDPADADIVWNSTDGRWEVSFDVSGFSGFFVKTSLYFLPLKLLNFSGIRNDQVIRLTWQTADELNTKDFVVERSSDGASFTGVTTVAAKSRGNNTYACNDPFSFSSQVYYRLKMTDQDGRFTYSNIIRISNIAGNASTFITVYPNPVKDGTTITINSNAPAGSKAWFTDMSGRILKEVIINHAFQMADISQFPAGMYLLRLANGTMQKIVKE